MTSPSSNLRSYLVSCATLGRSDERVTGYDPRVVAEEWAAAYDWDTVEFAIAKMGEVVVTVTELPEGKPSDWRVTCELVREYRAKRVTTGG